MSDAPVILVSSSDAEEAEGSVERGRRRRASKRSTSTSRTAQPTKKRRGAHTSGRGSAPSTSETCRTEQVDFDLLSEDFLDCLNGFGVVHGSKELWVDKYKPSSITDLAVHKKKVDEVRLWLEERMKTTKEGACNYTLLITGQAGVGKSATIQVIASHFGAELYEWITPTPTLWKEHLQNSNSGMIYMSKLDEFEAFVTVTRKYPVLSSTYIGEQRKPVILLIDDLPVTNGKAAFGRLRKCLIDLASSTQIPTIILITEYLKDNATDSRACSWEELESSLVSAGAHKVSFNPLTVNSIKKTLSRISHEERCNLSEELLDQVSRFSQGDIRHAITSLQYICLRSEQTPCSLRSEVNSTHSEENSGYYVMPLSRINADCGLSGCFGMPFGRDEILTLFHALGKFLHNKRQNDVASFEVKYDCDLKENLRRLPLKMDAPENVLCQAHSQARPIVDFLHENVLDFLNGEAMDDAWAVASYLSDADCLLAASVFPTHSQIIKGAYGPEIISQSIAASVSVRGVLFGNSQPLSSRWHSIRRPKLWQIEQSSRHNKDLMSTERLQPCITSMFYNITDMATVYKPMIRLMGPLIPEQMVLHERLPQFCSVKADDIDLDDLVADITSGENEEDDIQEW